MIRIHDVHEYEENRAESTIYVFGQLFMEDDGYRIVYREESGDMAGCTTTITCTGGKEVSVRREGPYRTDLTMEEGRRHSSHYSTEYGDLLLGIFAESVDSQMSETGGYLEFTYSIDYNGDFVSRNILHITVKETF